MSCYIYNVLQVLLPASPASGFAMYAVRSLTEQRECLDILQHLGDFIPRRHIHGTNICTIRSRVCIHVTFLFSHFVAVLLFFDILFRAREYEALFDCVLNPQLPFVGMHQLPRIGWVALPQDAAVLTFTLQFHAIERLG